MFLALPIQEPSIPTPPFAEIGARALPGVRTVCGFVEKDYIVEVKGGGVLLSDFDGPTRLPR